MGGWRQSSDDGWRMRLRPEFLPVVVCHSESLSLQPWPQSSALRAQSAVIIAVSIRCPNNNSDAMLAGSNKVIINQTAV